MVFNPDQIGVQSSSIWGRRKEHKVTSFTFKDSISFAHKLGFKSFEVCAETSYTPYGTLAPGVWPRAMGEGEIKQLKKLLKDSFNHIAVHAPWPEGTGVNIASINPGIKTKLSGR